jgi:hypothetical protein
MRITDEIIEKMILDCDKRAINVPGRYGDAISSKILANPSRNPIKRKYFQGPILDIQFSSSDIRDFQTSPNCSLGIIPIQ